MIIVNNTAGSFGVCPKNESISTSGLLSCMPVVIFYKDGDIGLLHYNLESHDDCIKAINRVENKNIDKIVLYTCKIRNTQTRCFLPNDFADKYTNRIYVFVGV